MRQELGVVAFGMRRFALLFFWLASCSGTPNNGGQAGNGGSVNTGASGAADIGGTGGGTGGAAATGGHGGTGGSGAQGAGGCLTEPNNDPGCHPADGRCRPGLTCEFLVVNFPTCDGQEMLESGICCALPASDQTGFFEGATMDACPRPIAGQDPACTPPLASTCAVEGLVCTYQATPVAFAAVQRQYVARCCDSAWVAGSSCPTDAGAD